MVGLKYVVILLAAALMPAASTTILADDGDDAPGDYIVTLKRDLSEADVSEHMRYTRAVQRRNLARRGDTVRAWNQGSPQEIKAGGHKSYAGMFDRRTIQEIRSHSAVAHVEENSLVHAWEGESIQQPFAPWGLGAISFNLSVGFSFPIEKFAYDESAGKDSWAYVIDGRKSQVSSLYSIESTALKYLSQRMVSKLTLQSITVIRVSHEEFEGRATLGASFVSNYSVEESSGHGTHVAAIIGGKTYGVAKKINIIGVTILDAKNAGKKSDVLRALEFVHDDARKHKRSARSVVNMSLGDKGNSPALNDIIKVLTDAGVVVVIAAGNEDSDTKEYTPANAPDALTVGAIAADNARAWFSNWGETVNIFAPGTNIVSAGWADDRAVSVRSGCSMAAPHVAGVAAYIRALDKIDDAREVIKKIEDIGTKDKIRDAKNGHNIIVSNGQHAKLRLD